MARGRDLGPRADALLGLEVDEHVGAAQAAPNLALELVCRRAGGSVARARRATTAPTARLATAETPTTAMPTPRRWTPAPITRWRMASKAITPDPTRMSIPSMAAERFSIFSCP